MVDLQAKTRVQNFTRTITRNVKFYTQFPKFCVYFLHACNAAIPVACTVAHSRIGQLLVVYLHKKAHQTYHVVS